MKSSERPHEEVSLVTTANDIDRLRLTRSAGGTIELEQREVRLNCPDI